MPSENTKKNFEFEQIEEVKLISVAQSSKRYFKNNPLFYIVLPIASGIAAFYLSFKYGIPHFFILLSFVILPYSYLYNSLFKKFIKDFALKIGFDYVESAEMSSVEGTLFNKGHSQNISEVVSGLYYNHESRFYLFTTIEGSGKHQTTYQFSVLEIKFDMMLPDIILDSKKDLLYPMLFLFNEKEIELEGDFGKYFNLYAPEDYEIEVLQIFSPDIMQMFINKTNDFNMEIYKDKVYIYHYTRVYNKEDIVLMYDLAKEVILRLSKTFLSMKGGVEAMSKYYKLT